MGRKATIKDIQIHYQCDFTGYNSVDSDSEHFSHRVLKQSGYKRRKDKKTGKYFYMLLHKCDAQPCTCGSIDDLPY